MSGGFQSLFAQAISACFALDAQAAQYIGPRYELGEAVGDLWLKVENYDHRCRASPYTFLSRGAGKPAAMYHDWLRRRGFRRVQVNDKSVFIDWDRSPRHGGLRRPHEPYEPPEPVPLDGLTEQEAEVVRLVARGLTHRQIGLALGVPANYVTQRVRRATERMRRAAAAMEAEP